METSIIPLNYRPFSTSINEGIVIIILQLDYSLFTILEELENNLNKGIVLYTISGAVGISKSPIGQFICYLLYYLLV